MKLYIALLVVALAVYFGTLARKNMWLWVAIYWGLLVAKCMMEMLREVGRG